MDVYLMPLPSECLIGACDVMTLLLTRHPRLSHIVARLILLCLILTPATQDIHWSKVADLKTTENGI